MSNGFLDPDLPHHTTEVPFLVAGSALLVGAVMLQFPKIRSLGKLVIFFGIQSCLDMYMGWVLYSYVTVPKGTWVPWTRTTLSKDLRGCPARLALSAFQQAVSFMAYVCVSLLTLCSRCRRFPRQLQTNKEVIVVLIFGSVHALSVALNSLNLGYVSLVVSLLIRAFLPLATYVLQRLLSLKHLYRRQPCKPLETLLLAVGVTCAGIFTTAQLIARGGWGKSPNMALGIVSCVASLFSESLNLALAGVLGEMRFNTCDTVAYMAVPAMMFMAPIAAFVPKTVPGDWPSVLGATQMTDFEMLSVTWHLNRRIALWLSLSGLVTFAYTFVRFSVVQALTPTDAAFAGCANQAGLVLLLMILPFVDLPTLPRSPDRLWTWICASVCIAAFVVYMCCLRLLESQPDSKSSGIETDPEVALLLDCAELVETDPVRVPVRSTVKRAFPEEAGDDWIRLGGKELEEPLKQGLIRLVRVSYLLRLAEDDDFLKRRQDVPEDAFLTFRELAQAPTRKMQFGNSHSPGIECEWLPILVLSYPWLQSSHPDTFGENLKQVVKACSLFPDDHGVLVDYTALPQHPRTPEEEAMFQKAVPWLSNFFAHNHTVVLKVTTLPEGYPSAKPTGLHYYGEQSSEDVAHYKDRGWCFGESCMSGLSKDAALIWDLSCLTDGLDLGAACAACMGGRVPPLDPEVFDAQLGTKRFSQPESDFDLVRKLYLDAYIRHVKDASDLQCRALSWGAREASRLFEVLRDTNVRRLNLQVNDLGNEGAAVVADALESNDVLEQLDLRLNSIGAEGARVLARGLRTNSALERLDLCDNNVGDDGTQAIVEALDENSPLRWLGLHSNGVGAAGAKVLGEALASRIQLEVLDLSWNLVGDQGARALGEALRSNVTLQKLDLHGNGLSIEAARALAEALCKNETLRSLDLSWNRMGASGASLFADALHKNAVLERLNLAANHIGPEGAQVLAMTLANRNFTLQVLDLTVNRVKAAGSQALANARENGACKISW